MNKPSIIAVLTDFGLSDAYVGTMKGIVLSLCPTARIVDLTHDIRPQNVKQAAYVLLTAYRFFPPGTVFLVVVDPGVGTQRKPIAVQTDRGLFVAPDNGVLSYVLSVVELQAAVVLDNSDYHLPDVSATFHGRDLFSPVAAHLANGMRLESLGSALDQLKHLPEPLLEVALPDIRGEVLHTDHFGNIITSIGHLRWIGADRLQLIPEFGPDQAACYELDAAACRVTVGSHTLHRIRTTYGAVPVQRLTSLVGSSGQLEIGMNRGKAARTLAVSIGDSITLHTG
ncbi:MAG: SAM-dependent chlorinase/fluorinase [Chloroflexi bacterium]|nr:SAM-dependent chlorinase/fluorinase [Chloroflexota bacterium]